MNTLPATVAWCVLQVTLLAAFVSVWCLVLRRSAAATRSLTACTGLALIVLLTLASFSPWPRWSTAGLASLGRPVERGSATASREVPSESAAREPQSLDAEQSQHDELPVATEPSAPDEMAAAGSQPSAADNEKPSPASLFWNSLLADLQPPAAAAKSIPTSEPAAVESRWTWPMVLTLAMLGGAAIGVLRLLAGLVLVRSYRVRSRPIADAELLELRDILQAELNCPGGIELRESDLLATAATVGWRKPLVILPTNWRTWSDAERRAVLAHEIAHIQRHDFVTWVAAQGALVLHFYHPLVHWLCGRLRLEQELAADAAAARLAGGQQVYLSTLAAMALRQSDRPVAWPARTFLPTRGTFMRRIEMLRDMKLGSATTSLGARVGTVGVLLTVGLVVAGLRGGEEPAGSTPEKRLAAEEQQAAAELEALSDAVDPKNSDSVLTALGEPISLEYVPRDAMLVATVRPAEFLARKEFAPLAKSLRERTQQNQGTVIAPERVEQLTVAILSQGDPSHSPFVPICFILRAKQADDIAALTKGGLANGTAEAYGDQEYVKTPGGWSYLRVDERTIILAPEPMLRRVIIAKKTGGATRAKWSGDWKVVATDPAAMIINLESVRGTLERLMSQATSEQSNALSQFVMLCKNAATAVLALKWTDPLTLEGVVHSRLEDGAIGKAHDALSSIVALAKSSLSEVRSSAAMLSDASGASLLVAADVADLALDGVQMKFNGQDVLFNTVISERDVAQLATPLVSMFATATATSSQAPAKNNLKQIGLAMHNYHDAFKSFPPAQGYGKIGDGKSKYPYSWRVALLPFLDHADLYNRYNFAEPWDSENNRKILAQMPAVYRDSSDPADSTNASYFVLVGAGPIAKEGEGAGGFRAGVSPGGGFAEPLSTMFSSAEGTKISQVYDGTSNTLLVVEAKRDIPWTKPEDIPYAEDKPLPKLGGHYPGGFSAVFVDGSTAALPSKIDEQTLRLLITRNDGKPVKDDRSIRIVRDSPAGTR